MDGMPRLALCPESVGGRRPSASDEDYARRATCTSLETQADPLPRGCGQHGLRDEASPLPCGAEPSHFATGNDTGQTMKNRIRMMAAAVTVLGAVGLAQAQGSASGGSGSGAGGTGNPAGATGIPGSGGSPTGGTNSGLSSSKSSTTTNTGNSADTGNNSAAAHGMSSASGSKKAKRSHAKSAKQPVDPASVAPGSSAG